MLFADNTWRYTYALIYSIQWFFSQPTPLLPVLALICPFLYDLTPLFTHLENQLILLMMRIPIHSCPWFAINCSPLSASTTPRHPTDQVTYLHRQHQQRQTFGLTQLATLCKWRIDQLLCLEVDSTSSKIYQGVASSILPLPELLNTLQSWHYKVLDSPQRLVQHVLQQECLESLDTSIKIWQSMLWSKNDQSWKA